MSAQPISQSDAQGGRPTVSFAEFLEKYPPNEAVDVNGVYGLQPVSGGSFQGVSRPQLQLYCPSETCNGLRFFRCTSPVLSTRAARIETFVKYTCANCQKFEKTFALGITVHGQENSNVLSQYGTVMKFGELPPFGPPTPARLISLVGPDRDLFLKGRRCENQGLGIGAFIYYRRVVDNQRKRILLEIARVAERTGAPPETVELFRQAADETQFAQAIERTKAAFPLSLLIKGHNPLALLYAALSEAVHNHPDEECLAIASSIRIVLAELSERLGQALKDEVELRNALTTIMQKRTDVSDPTAQLSS